MVIPDPCQFLCDSPLTESLVLRLVHHGHDATVELVYDYAAQKVSESFERRLRGVLDCGNNVREFRRLVFGDVPTVVCAGRPWPGFGIASATDLKSHAEGDAYKVVTMMDVTRCEMRFVASLEMQEFGPYEFHFSTLELTRRCGRGTAREGGIGWVYVDVETGVEFDPMEPF